MFYPNPNHFSDKELLPTEILQRYGGGGKFLLNPLMLITLQQLRNRFGRIRANSPKLGFFQRMLRTVDYYIDQKKRKFPEKSKAEIFKLASESYQRYWGLHKVGGAADIDFLDADREEVIDYIRNNPDEFPFISFIEVDITWFHFDVRNQAGITFWSPNDGVLEVVEQQPIDWEKIVDISGKDTKWNK